MGRRDAARVIKQPQPGVMKCSRCQHENRTGAKFCEQCAAPLERACGNCGALASPTAKFCPECAHPVGRAAAPEQFDAPKRYTPKHLAEKILTSKSALEGERKQVTVLFADLKGSMELLADRDPEEARKILDPVLERMMEAVHHYEGTVNQVMGDGIMALFGAPLAHEDHAVRACYAALRMQDSVRRYSEEMRRAHGATVRIRVGLNSGEVVVRAIGSDLHMDYTAVGQTTHLAARMEQLADPGAILLSADTLRLAEGYVQVKSLGPVPVKGLPEPIEIFELTGAGMARTRLQAAALRGLTRFVGRDAEVEHLRRFLTQAGARHGQVVAIVGEAGVGKSRLTYEFTHSHRVQDWLIVEASSVSYGKATSYFPVIDLLKGYFKIGDRDDHRGMREKVTGKLFTLDESLKPLLPPLLALLDVPVDDPSWQNHDPPQRRQRTLDAVKRLLLREAQVQPLLVVFEDLHWIDGETQALLDNIVENVSSARLLLLVNYRPEYEHHWGRKTAYSQLRLDSLPAESAAELLAALVGPDPGLAPLTQMLVKRGNPFFLEETVRTLVETGALAGERGAYRLTRPVEALRVPPTVQTILAARIDRLPAEEKQLLQAASVIGKDVPFALLAAIAEQPEETLRRGLGHLQEAEFLYETRLFPDLEHTFKHALTHEVTYGSLLQERRHQLHARIMTAIERLYPDRLSEHVERLAHHALRGQLWDQSVRYSRWAGTRALDHSAAREALAAFDQARTALQELPDSRERTEQRVDLCIEQRSALFPLGEFARQGEVLNEARALAEGLGDQRRLGLTLAYQAVHHGILGEHARAIEAGERASAIAEAVGDVGLRVVATYYLGLALRYAGDPRRAAHALRAVIALVNGAPLDERFGMAGLPTVLAHYVLAVVLAELGEFTEALAAGEEGLRIAERVGHAYSEVYARFGLGYAHLRHGNFAAATRVLEPGLALCRATEIRFALPYFAASLGSAYLWSGRASEAVPLLEEAVTAYTAMRILGLRSWIITALAEGYLVLGRIAEAREQTEQAVALAHAHPQRGWEASCLKLLGDIHARAPVEVKHGGVDQSADEQAADAYRQALALATELGMRPLVAHCHFGLGKLRAKTGQREEASEHLTKATAMYREMDMRFWREKAEIEITGLA
ncbi:MAG: adenylate/guanylate cyclase domain-containing protein [Betaproteobacteria bacterium]